ncbi:MAG: hypothetical protein QM831_17940 [Kofleriaceae bacterium]
MKMLGKALSLVAFFAGTAVLRADNPAPEKPKLTNADISTKAAGLETQIQEADHQLTLLKAKAVKMKDVIKVNCVNDKLVQAKAQMNIADNASSALQIAMAKNNDEERNTEFGNLSQAADSMKQLKEEAAACIGAPELLKQENGLTVDKPFIPDDPTLDDPFHNFDPDPTQNGEMDPPAFPSPWK